VTHIEHAEVIVTSPGRNFVTLKLVTSDGVVGYGDATLNGRELAVVSYLRDHLVPLLGGRDPHRIEDTWQYLYRGAYWRRGPVTMTAISAVDVALWDIKGKIAGLPLYQLLGGASREGCLAYCHATGRDVPELIDSVRAHVELGYRAVRAQIGVPGIETIYGVSIEGPGAAYEPARRQARPVEEVWDTGAYMRYIPTVFEALRAELGPELPLLHDAHHRLTPIQAAQLGRALEPYDLFWLEDVTPAESQDALRTVRRHTVTPLAIGEVFNTIWDCQTILEDRLVDYIRTCATHAGGITHLRRIFQLAELHQVKSGAHGATDISPVGLAATLHLGLAIPNFGIQEHHRHDPLVDAVFPHAYAFADGYLHPGDEPGLGVSLDEELAFRNPYERAYLPVNRLSDGTMHDW
jgi:mannonate dehydratase